MIYTSQLPTTDLYFLNSCKELVKTHPFQKRPFQRIGSNCFKHKDKVLIIRKDSKQVIEKILQTHDLKIFYLIDDNIWEGCNDTSLPAPYRKRLAQLVDQQVNKILPRAEQLIVSTEELTQYAKGSQSTHILNPTWVSNPPSSEHFTSKEFKLVHLGTNSHLASFHFLKDVLNEILDTYPHVSFNYYSNSPLLGDLDKHPRVSRSRIMRWRKYKQTIGKKLFHLALYPILDTPFNRCRSLNKILEHTLSGCPGIYSDNWSYSKYVQHNHNGWSLMNSTKSWVDQISYCIENKNMVQKAYLNATEQFSIINNASNQKRFWMDLFNITRQ